MSPNVKPSQHVNIFVFFSTIRRYDILYRCYTIVIEDAIHIEFHKINFQNIFYSDTIKLIQIQNAI